TRCFQLSDQRRKIRDGQNDAVPSARLLTLTVRHRARAGRTGTAEQDLDVAKGDTGKSRQLLVLEPEPEVLRIECYRARDILGLVANAMKAFYECVSVYVMSCCLNHVVLLRCPRWRVAPLPGGATYPDYGPRTRLESRRLRSRTPSSAPVPQVRPRRYR